MRIEWSEQATRGWKEVATYIKRDFGRQGLLLFKQRTKEAEEFILKFPNGCEEVWRDPETNVSYRWRTIHGRSKILYFVQGEVITIADFWDVRSNRASQGG